MCIDPLTEDYPTWAPYVFSGNRVVEAKELEGLETWFSQDGSLATKAGPYTDKARKQLNLYSPSELQQMKAKQTNSKQPMLSQDRLSSSERKNLEKINKSIPTTTEISKERSDGKSGKEKIGETAKNFSESAEKVSTATKITSAIVGFAGAVSGNEYLVPLAIDGYTGCMAISSAGQVAKGVSLSTQDGKGTEAALEIGNVVLGEVTGGWIDKIPGVSDVTKVATKTAVESAIDSGKEKTKVEIDKK